MALIDKARGLILAEALKQTSKGLFHPDGRPNALRISAEMGLSHQALWRLLTGNPDRKSGARSRRDTGQAISPQLIRGLQRWLRIAKEEDVWLRIARAHPVPPLVTTRPRPRRKI